MIAKIINTVFYTVCILLIIGLFVVFGSKTAKACDYKGNKAEIRKAIDAQAEKKFRESMDAECKAMVPKIWRKCSTWKEIEDAKE